MKREEKKLPKTFLWQITKFYSGFPPSFLPIPAIINRLNYVTANTLKPEKSQR
jgi:hypothetical protein